LVLFRSSPMSIVKVYLASRVHNAKPVEASEGRRFYFEDSMDADKLDYDSLYNQYKEVHGGLDFLEDDKLWEILEDEIFWASRFNSPDRFQLILTVLAQIEKTGTKSYLAQQTLESREMKDRVRRVTGEFRRAKQYLTFTEDAANKVLIGKAGLEHRIADLVLRHYAKRNPGYTIVTLDEENAHICYKDEILVEPRKKFPERPGKKDANRYWMLLSDLKHLESKRDMLYQTYPLPRNYWKWVSEGVQSYGSVPKITLDDFTAQT